MPLETMETRWGPAIVRIHRDELPRAALWVALAIPRQLPDVYVEPAGEATDPTVEVRVNHGVWQTECPWCLSAQHASDSDRFFYCADCLNRPADHHLLPVAWPADADQLADQLELRPLKDWRNWEPGETVADLQEQDERAIAAGMLPDVRVADLRADG